MRSRCSNLFPMCATCSEGFKDCNECAAGSIDVGNGCESGIVLDFEDSASEGLVPGSYGGMDTWANFIAIPQGGQQIWPADGFGQIFPRLI